LTSSRSSTPTMTTAPPSVNSASAIFYSWALVVLLQFVI
jgi:hypothetical protein